MGCIINKFSNSQINKYNFYKKLDNNGKMNLLILKSKNKMLVRKLIKNNKSFLNELTILKKISSNITLNFLTSYSLNKGGYIYYEYIEGYDLYDFLKNDYKNDIKIVKCILKQMSNCISFCHSKNIIHLDIKLENFICVNKDPSKIRLIDFGLSVECYSNYCKIESYAGTIPYCSPEIYFLKAYFRSDVWSLGCTIFTFIRKEKYHLFPCENYKNIILSINNSKYLKNIFKKELNISDELLDLLNRIFIFNPNNRISINDIIKHKFLVD